MYCGIWSQDGVQAQAAVRRDGRAARGATLLEAHVEVRVLEALPQVEAGKGRKAGSSRLIIETSEPRQPSVRV